LEFDTQRGLGFSMAQLVLKYYGNKVDLKEYYLSSEESM
jgi:hypothetical protein